MVLQPSMLEGNEAMKELSDLLVAIIVSQQDKNKEKRKEKSKEKSKKLSQSKC